MIEYSNFILISSNLCGQFKDVC